MNKKNKHPHACQSQQKTDNHGNMRNENRVSIFPDSTQHQETIQKGGEKGAEYHLIAHILHEILQESGAELGGCQSQGYDGNRKRDTGYGDNRTSHGSQQGAGSRWTQCIEKSALYWGRKLEITIQQDGKKSQDHR